MFDSLVSISGQPLSAPIIILPENTIDSTGEVFYKKCPRCGIEKSFEEYYKKRDVCKQCVKIYNKEYQTKNEEKLIEKRKIYYQENKDHILAYGARYQEKHREELNRKACIYASKYKEKRKEYKQKWLNDNNEKAKTRRLQYVKENQKKIKEAYELYMRKNGEKVKERQRIRYRKMMQSCPEYKVMARIRARFKKFLKKNGQSKSIQTKELIGCDSKFLKEHLQYALTFNGHIDHILPINKFPQNGELFQTSLKIMWNYRNLQLLSENENLFKSGKLPKNWKEILISIGNAIFTDVSKIMEYIENNIKPGEIFWEKDYFSIK